MRIQFAMILVISFLLSAPRALAAEGYTVDVLDTQNLLIRSFTPFPEGVSGSLAVADLGNDGTAEVLVGAGFGMKPIVRVFRQDGSTIGEFLAYDEGFKGGVNVAICDLDNDGKSEIITGAGFSGGPHVRVFNNLGKPTGVAFFAYSEAFHGGVNIACDDVTGDGTPEIITGAGLSGGPHVRIFNPTGVLLAETFIGPATSPTGAYVTLTNTDNDPQLEILASPMNSSETTLLSWTANKLLATSTSAHPTQTRIQTDEDSTIVNHATTVNGNTFKLKTPALLGDATLTKSIKVDLSEQRLYAYENGIPVNSFLVSTGKQGWTTPLGITAVTDKIPIMDYRWNYGANNPNNYSLPNVKWNLRFRPHYYIHSAYWHNNFGHVMSHGCVNTSIPDAEWIYSWAMVGTTVTIQN